MKNKLFWFIGSIAALSVSYVLCRYVFFGLHGNKGWSGVLFVLGAVVLLISARFYCRRIMVSTVAGYMIGFILGIVFNAEGRDPGTTTWWIIWTVSFLVFILAGIVWEVISKCLRKE
ncbi:MAG: hypothetical protein FWE80_00840 [Oscillospiraceae bacterium]|nr:hypothetical protein [Oscillospiraceae bacterium]